MPIWTDSNKLSYIFLSLVQDTQWCKVKLIFAAISWDFTRMYLIDKITSNWHVSCWQLSVNEANSRKQFRTVTGLPLTEAHTCARWWHKSPNYTSNDLFHSQAIVSAHVSPVLIANNLETGISNVWPQPVRVIAAWTSVSKHESLLQSMCLHLYQNYWGAIMAPGEPSDLLY